MSAIVKPFISCVMCSGDIKEAKNGVLVGKYKEHNDDGKRCNAPFWVHKTCYDPDLEIRHTCRTERPFPEASELNDGIWKRKHHQRGRHGRAP